MTTTDFSQQVILAVVDKGILAGCLVVLGFFINRRLEAFRTGQQRVLSLERDKVSLEMDLEKARRTAHASFIEKQLSQFYWPIRLRFEKDSAMWGSLPHLTDGKGSLPIQLAVRIENEFIMKNHSEIVKIIEDNIHLAIPDENLLMDLIAYIKHVAVYQALRSSNDYSNNPIGLGHSFPKGLIPRIEEKTADLQKEFQQSILIMEQSDASHSRQFMPDPDLA